MNMETLLTALSQVGLVIAAVYAAPRDVSPLTRWGIVLLSVAVVLTAAILVL